MSEAGLVGMRATGEDALLAAAALTPEQWRAPSAAGGWSVQDVFIHLGSLLELLQSAVGGATVPPLGIEELNDQIVAQRRGWTPSETVEFLRDQLDSAERLFTSLQVEPMASTEAPLLDLGSYPLHSIADMFTFDMLAHLRWDVLAPRGPVPSAPIPELDSARLTPAVDWLVGGLPRMQPHLAEHVPGALLLLLTGPGGRDLSITAVDGALTVGDSDIDPVATITSSTTDFVAWSTTRSAWRPLVHIDGDRDAASSFLDAVNLI
jgi:uncharacterized protein (TIGR03083 family)